MENNQEQPVISPDMQESALLKLCPVCKHNISKNANICPHCGGRFQSFNRKNKLVAGLLAFCLGGIGIHKFYLGQTMQGILYLLFAMTFIPTIIAFIEGIYYIAVDEDEFDKKYNNELKSLV